MKQILCLSMHPWSSTPARTQQLFSRLREIQILYFCPAAGRGDRSWKQPGKKVRPNITVYTLPPLPLGVSEHFITLFRAEHRRLSRFVQEKADRHRFRSPLLWVTSPEYVHLLDELDYDSLVYDCDREWDNLPLDWEGSLAQAADVVFTASPLLSERLAPCSSNIALLPNGVNYSLFASPNANTVQDPLPKVKGPLFGWAGTITPDLDLQPILSAARERPGWNFLLLGRCLGHELEDELRKLRNVIFAGPVPLNEVPDWLYRCDVLVDLLHRDRVDDGVVPTRLYEYLSTGKPIVSMLSPGVPEQFPEVVYGTYDRRQFSALCRRALEETPGFAARRRREHGASAAWSTRAGELSQILLTTGLL